MLAPKRPRPPTPGPRARLRRLASGLALPAALSIAPLAALAAALPSPLCTPQYPPAISCVKSVSVTKAFPRVVVVPPGGVRITVRVTVNTASGAQPGFVCAMPAPVLGGAINVSICNAAMVPVAMGNAPLAARPAGFASGTIPVNVMIPGGTPPGVYTVKALVPVQFGPDSSNPAQVIIGRGDTQLCIVEPAPQDPSLPRLDLETLTDPLVNCPPGAQYLQTYRVTNNDLVNSVSLTVTGESRQNARMPSFDPMNPGTNSAYSISAPVSGDDFPIDFAENLPPGGLLPLPPNPDTYVQMAITKMISIPPGGSEDVSVVTRSYGGCADGSCGEYLMTVQGNFSNGDPALACVGGGVNVLLGADPHPAFYCTGKTTSTGCVPFLTTSGTASATSTGAFGIRTNDNVTTESGVMIYSFKKANLNFHGGKLCVKAPFNRTGAKPAKSTACVDPGATCTTGICGFINRNFNVVIQNGSDPMLTVGQTVNAQWRQRDPTNFFGDNLSDAVSFVIGP